MVEASRSDILKRFGENLREARQRTGLSQEEMAAKAGIDRTYVGGAERGEWRVALVNVVSARRRRRSRGLIC